MLAKLLTLLMMLLSLGQDVIGQYADEMSLGGNLFLVNRDYALASDYVPNDLTRPDVQMTSSNIKMRSEAGGNVSGRQG